MFTVDRVDDLAESFGCSDMVPLDCSLRTAITLANANPGPDTIQLPAAVTLNLTIDGWQEDLNQTGDLDVLDDLTILGSAGQRPTIDARGGAFAGGVIDVHTGASLAMSDVDVLASDDGGGTPVRGRSGATGLVLERVLVDAGSAPGGPRGVEADADTVVLRDVQVEAEIESVHGRGSAQQQVDLHIENSLLIGTVDLKDVAATIVDTEIVAIGLNGVLVEDGVTDVSFVGSTVFNGLSDIHGLERGIYFDSADGTLFVYGSRFSYGFESDGGAVQIWEGTAEIRDSTFTDNSAVTGGAIAVGPQAGAVVIEGCTFIDNEAVGGLGRGGAVSTESPSLLQVRNSTFTDNQARFGGAIWVSAGAQAALNSVTVSGNVASAGSALLVDGTASVLSSLVEGSCSGGGTTTSFGGNLESPGSTCGFVQAFDQANIPNLLLGPLAPGGGPTEVMVPQPGSPAVDRLPFCSMPTDQRGGSRPAGASASPLCDVGAVEVGSLEIFADGFESGTASNWSAAVPAP